MYYTHLNMFFSPARGVEGADPRKSTKIVCVH